MPRGVSVRIDGLTRMEVLRRRLWDMEVAGPGTIGRLNMAKEGRRVNLSREGARLARKEVLGDLAKCPSGQTPEYRPRRQGRAPTQAVAREPKRPGRKPDPKIVARRERVKSLRTGESTGGKLTYAQMAEALGLSDREVITDMSILLRRRDVKPRNPSYRPHPRPPEELALIKDLIYRWRTGDDQKAGRKRTRRDMVRELKEVGVVDANRSDVTYALDQLLKAGLIKRRK